MSRIHNSELIGTTSCDDACVSISIKSRRIKRKLVASNEIETLPHHWRGTVSVSFASGHMMPVSTWRWC